MREQLDEDDVGSILGEVQAVGRISLTAVPTTRVDWAQWSFLMVRDSMLERHWEPADGRSSSTSNQSEESNRRTPQMIFGRISELQ
jgi:hypothetical protein